MAARWADMQEQKQKKRKKKKKKKEKEKEKEKEKKKKKKKKQQQIYAGFAGWDVGREEETASGVQERSRK